MTAERVKGMVKIRDVTNELIQCQMEEGSDEQITKLQGKLNEEFLKGDADMIGLVCNTIRKLFCMSDEGYEIFLMDLEDYKAELEDNKEEKLFFYDMQCL